MPVVSNSSPLIALAEIELLPLLAELFESVLIPPAVAAEIARTISTHPAWLRVEPLKTSIRPDVIRPALGSGEREALSLAAELAADWLIVDDLAARRIARELHLRVTGIRLEKTRTRIRRRIESDCRPSVRGSPRTSKRLAKSERSRTSFQARLSTSEFTA